LQRAFPLDISMVPSSAISITADGKRLTCNGFSLGKTVLLGNFEFITDYFGDLSLSSMRGNVGTAFMGSTRSGAPASRRAMIEDSVEEFLMTSSRALSQQAQHMGFTRSHHNHTKEGEHSGHDDGSPADDGTAAENRPPFQATSRSSRGAIGASPCSVAHHQAMSNATVKQARRQASRYYGSTARTTVTRAHSRGRDDLDGGLHLHSSSGQEPTHEATKSKPLSASPPLTADRVDKMHDQLEEIHAFTAMQLAECARWRRSESTPSSARAGTSQSRPVVTPSMIRLAPSPPTDFSSQALPWQR
jgi:hypothetical protein